MIFSKKAIFLLLLVVILIIITKSFIYGPNDMSRFATIKNLVENHSFVLSQPKAITADTIMVGGNYYSSKPPLLSILGAGIYWVLRQIFNLDLPLEFIQSNLSVYLINLLIVGGASLLLVVFFFKSLSFYNLTENSKIFLSAILMLATLIFSYLGTLNNHIPVAAFIYVSFYYLLKQIKKGFSNKYSLLTGFFLSISFCLEPIFSGVFIFFIFIYYLTGENEIRFVKTLVLGLLPLIVIYALTNVAIIGSLLPPYFNKSLYEYPGSYWLWPSGTDALYESKIVYAFNLLIGSYGLFLYTPILLYSLGGLKKIIFSSAQADIKRITTVISLAITSYILFLIIFTHNYGGSSYGVRWFIGFVPLLLFYLAIFYHEVMSKHANIFITLLVFSVIFSLLGYLDPWFHNSIRTTNTYYFPLLAKIMYFKELVSTII